jgi:ADP-dependent phosphofructokinase/glucokinase
MGYFRIFLLIICINLIGAKKSGTPTSSDGVRDYDIYIPPSSSTVCASLKKSLRKRINHKQKLEFLLIRNKKILKEVSKRRKSIIKKLGENKTELRTKKLKNSFQIKTLEEKIIRRGCPGILTPSFSSKKSS